MNVFNTSHQELAHSMFKLFAFQLFLDKHNICQNTGINAFK
jgi:hypothetical protein